MKKILLSLCLLLVGAFANAQNGLENIVVEKYYVSNAADAAGSIGTLPVGSVTYRIYADMLPGYEFQAAYGVPGHDLILSTSTSFFNNEDRGATTPTYTKTQARANTIMLDSWLSVGAGCAGQFGVLKSEDDLAGGATVVNSNVPPILQNADPSAGIPLTTHDGLYTGTPEAVTFVGLTTELDVFDATSQQGNLFTTSNGSWAALNGASGPLASNRVLIAQITTDGVFNYELNIQIGTPTGGVQQFVARNPVGAEITIPSLIGTLGAPNNLPTVNITSPAAAASFNTGDPVTIEANANDADGSVSQVEFFVNGVSVGVDNTSPYSVVWTSTGGNKTLTAVATDNNGGSTTSSSVNITVTTNGAPTVSLTAPINGSFVVAPASVTISANASDAGGSISQVEFFVNGSSVGIDNSSPYSVSWTSVIGTAVITAVATDNQNATATSAPVTIDVLDPNGPPYRIQDLTADCFQSTSCIRLSATSAVSNVIGYDIVLQYNKNKVTPTGVTTVDNDLINPNYTSVSSSIDSVNGLFNVSVYFNSSAPAGTFFSGLGDLLCVEFIKTANFNSVDTVTFTVTSLQESYLNGVGQKLVAAGDYISYRDSSFSASLRFWEDNSPIRYDASAPSSYLITNINGNNAGCNSPSAALIQPDLSGNFTFSTNNGSQLNINRNIDGATSILPVVNGFDAFLATKVLTNDLSFVPSVYQMIAMDVNMDGVVSSGDISQINQRTVLAIDEYRQAWNYNAGGVSNGQPSKDWQFIDASTVNLSPAYRISATYPANDGIGFSKSRVPVVPFCLTVPVSGTLDCPVINSETYKAIMVGDVNGSWSASGNPSVHRTASVGNVTFDLSNAVIANGYLDMPVIIDAPVAVNSLDFEIMYNENLLTYHSVINHAGVQALANYNANDHTLRFTSSSQQGYAMNTPVVSIRFQVNGSVNVSDFSTMRAFLNGSPSAVQMTNAISTGISNISAYDKLISVFPNPAVDQLNVVVPENAVIEVLDMEGRLVMTPRQVIGGQKAEINTQSFENGVYLLKVSNDNFVSLKRVVIKK